jgi:hypothetical protein
VVQNKIFQFFSRLTETTVVSAVPNEDALPQTGTSKKLLL